MTQTTERIGKSPESSDKAGPTTRTAVITGGANGIGRGFAARLARDGMDVAILDLADPAAAVTEVEDAGQRGIGRICDIADPGAVIECGAEIESELGPCDILVHCAGLLTGKLFEEMEESEWNRMIDVNLSSIFRLTKAFLPGMVDRGWGRIVSVSSTSFHAGLATTTHYTASKAGLIGFTRALAPEVGDSGVTVNTIAPGLVRTERTEAFGQEWFETFREQQSIKRTPVPADLAGVLAFLVSDDAAFITGQTLVVDGGMVRS